jgi:tRNA (Thr-GGU) A37 N-methylase
VPTWDGLDEYARTEVIYWPHQSRRDLVRESSANSGTVRGTLASCSLMPPNSLGVWIITDNASPRVLY